MSLGVKRICAGCSAKYYDLEKEIPECPKCGHHYTHELVKNGKKVKKATVSKAPKKVAKKSAGEEDEDLDLSGFEEPEDLGGDDDAMESLEEMDELDGDLESLPEVGEREREEDIMNSDDAEDDAFIEEMDEVETLVDKPEDEFDEDFDDEDSLPGEEEGEED